MTARKADPNSDGTIKFGGTPPFIFLGIAADDNEAIVTADCLYYINGEPHKLIDALPGDPENGLVVIY